MMNFLERMLGTGAPSAAAGQLRVRLGADLELGRREVPAVVSGTVSADADPAPSMAGGTVTLRTAAGEPVGTVTTGSDGTFSFADVADGQYRIVVSGPDLVDEGGSPTDGYSAVFAVADGTPGPALQAADLQTDPSGSGVGAVLTVVRQADPSGSGLDEVLAAVRADVNVSESATNDPPPPILPPSAPPPSSLVFGNTVLSVSTAVVSITFPSPLPIDVGDGRLMTIPISVSLWPDGSFAISGTDPRSGLSVVAATGTIPLTGPVVQTAIAVTPILQNLQSLFNSHTGSTGGS